MDGSDFLTGALVALIAAVVIPFLTTQWSLWSEQKRSLQVARRAALDAWVEAEAETGLNFARRSDELQARGTGGSIHTSDTDIAQLHAARMRVIGLFTLSDRHLMAMLQANRPDPRDATYLTGEQQMILATWAAGREFRARRAARRLRQHGSEGEKDAPERDRSE